MRRKVFSSGPSLVITLPKEWVTKYNLKSGDEIDLSYEQNGIKLCTNQSVRSKSTEIDVTNLDRTYIQLYLRSLYKTGYDNITIMFGDKTVEHIRTHKVLGAHDVIKEKVANLIGMEEMEKTQNSVVIQDVTGCDSDKFEVFLRKAFIQTMEYIKEYYDSLEEGNIDVIPLDEKHNEIEKVIAYAIRLLNKRTGIQHSDFSVYCHLLESLELIIDVIKYSARDAEKLKQKISDETVKYISEVYEMTRLYYQIFYKFANTDVHVFNSKRDDLKKKLGEIRVKIPSEELIVLKDCEHLIDILFLLVESRMALAKDGIL